MSSILDWITGTTTNTNTVGGKAVSKLIETETEQQKSEYQKKKEAQKEAEELLSNQPDYTIPESVQSYVNLMTNIGNLLGGITDASGGGSPSYTAEPYTVKNVPGYGDKGYTGRFASFSEALRALEKQKTDAKGNRELREAISRGTLNQNLQTQTY